MNKKVSIGKNGKPLTLLPSDYKASGGQAEIYVKNNKAFKIYYDPAFHMPPLDKIKELNVINNKNVIIPEELIYEISSGNPIGYVTNFIDNTEPIIKLFTRTFKNDNNIDNSMIVELIKYMQLITKDIHKANCLVVDYNELNILVDVNSSVLTPYYIDVDSYATPSHEAVAIMESIRDRKATTYDSNGKLHYNPTIYSDWFSWGILAFNIYTNIHPYRGNHPNYKKDKNKQMDDNISVFHSDVRVPPSVNNFNIIPKRHLDWFEDTFKNNRRSIPPLPDSSVPLSLPSQIITIKGTDKLIVNEIANYPFDISSVFPFMGVNYVVTKNVIYANQKEIIRKKPNRKTILTALSDGDIIMAELRGDMVYFSRITDGIQFGNIESNDVFQRNNLFYTISSGKLIENSFIKINNNIIHKSVEIENVSKITTKIYDGCVIQDLLGRKYLTLPYKQSHCLSKHIPELDKYRIIEAKCDKNIIIVIGEKNNVFNRFIIVFDKKYESFEVREVSNIAYEKINFAVLENGLCLLLSSSSEIELFFKNTQKETLSDPPFDSDMTLFSSNDGFYFINGNSIYKLKKN